jgi:hypothetical protein
MMEGIGLGNILQIGAYIVTSVVVVAVLRNDIKWITKWCDDHQERDDQHFVRLEANQQRIENELRDLARNQQK